MKILESFTRSKYIGRLCLSKWGVSPIDFSKEAGRNMAVAMRFRSKFDAPGYTASLGEVPE